MSDEKPTEEKAEEAAPAKKGGGGIALVAALITVIGAGGASFFGAKFGTKGGAAHAATHVVEEEPPPGPTLALEPFLVNTFDAQKRPHAMKVTLALEFSEKTKEEHLKPLVPRVRDAALTHVESR